MPLIPGPDGPLECLATGSGTPVTLFAHGLGGSIDETRPFGSGVVGTRVFFHFRGHGASGDSETPWSYDAAAADARAVMTAYDARRGLGVSLGAGALLRCAVDEPDAFERLVFVLPATIDQPREDEAVALMQARAELVAHRDLVGLAESLVAEQPAGVRNRPDVRLWAERQARRLSSTSVARALRELPPQHPVSSRSELAAVRCPVLVIAQQGDAAHPAAIAEALAGLLPSAELEVYDDGGVLWSHRAEVRTRISTFLNHP
jgi:pimeloyl-ACP methyl ester carboxylesterase